MSSTDPKLKKLLKAEAVKHDPFAALRFRDYRLFMIGRVLLFTGSQMQTVAIGWELYERTGSALALGGVGLAQVLPMIGLTLIAGHVADRRDRPWRALRPNQAERLCPKSSIWGGGFLFMFCFMFCFNSANSRKKDSPLQATNIVKSTSCWC